MALCLILHEKKGHDNLCVTTGRVAAVAVAATAAATAAATDRGK